MNGGATPGNKPAGRITVDCTTCGAKPNGLCRDYPRGVLRQIARYKCCDRTTPADQDLIDPGQPCDAIHNLVAGWVFLYNLSPDGRRQIVHFALPGAILGFFPAKRRATYGARALTDAVVCVIPRANLDPLIRERPDIGMRLAWLVARDRSLAYDHLASAGRLSARERVAHLLLELVVRYQAQWPTQQVGEIPLPLTQEHVGDAVGLSAVHVNRVLRILHQDRIISFHHRRLRILDPDRLWQVADLDPQTIHSWTQSE